MTEAVGGAGVTDNIRVDDETYETHKKRLISVGYSFFSQNMRFLSDLIFREPLSSICISLTSSTLLVGTLGGLIHLYDIPSHQLLRTISTHKGLSIAHLETMIKPPDLIGHINLDFRAGTADTRDVIPVKPVVPFRRMRDAKARDAHEVTMMLPSYNTVCSYSYPLQWHHTHAISISPVSPIYR